MKKPRKKGLDLMTKRAMSGWLFVLPFLIGFLFFVVSPLYTSFMLSINETDVVKNTELAAGYEATGTANTCYRFYVDGNGQPILDADGNKQYFYETDENGNIVTEEVTITEVDETGAEVTKTVTQNKKVKVRSAYDTVLYTDEGELLLDENGNKQYVMAVNDDGSPRMVTVESSITGGEPITYQARATVDVETNQKTIKYVGFSLYKKALTGSARYIEYLTRAAGRIIYVPAILIFSFLIANVLNAKFRGRVVARAIFFMPVVTATGIAYNLKNGNWNVARAGSTVTGALQGSDLDMVQGIKDVLSDVEALVPFVNFISTAFENLGDIILFSGVQILIFLAALQTISPSLFEASDMEGASKWEAFWKITFPMVSPMILVSLMYTMIDVFTGQNNPVINGLFADGAITGLGLSDRMAMGWFYFLISTAVIVIVSTVVSKFVYYENDTK